MENNKGIITRSFRAAFPCTIPILAGFLFLGMAYGIYMNVSGFSFVYPMIMAAVIFGGSLEFLAAQMLLSPFAPLQVLMVSLMIQARHLFYGISMLDKFKMSKFVFTRFAGTNWIFDDKYYSDLVDEAIQSSVIQAARLEGTDVRILTCPYANVWRLASFSQEEINELVSIVAKVNTAADEAILSRLRKGKLRIL